MKDHHTPADSATEERRAHLDQLAVAAVLGGLRPRVRQAIHQRATWPRDRPEETAREQLERSIAENLHTERTVPFWKSTGPQLTDALQAVADVDAEIASYLVGASLHALILGGQDTAPDHVLRLAERAASWHAGHTSAPSPQTSTEGST